MSLARVNKIEIAEYRDGTRIRQYLNEPECVGITLAPSEFKALPSFLEDKSYVILCKSHKLFSVPDFVDIPRDCEFIILNSSEIKDLKEAMKIYMGTSRYYN